jgi:hypothetical protein
MWSTDSVASNLLAMLAMPTHSARVEWMLPKFRRKTALNLEFSRITGSLILYGAQLGSIEAEDIVVRGGLLVCAFDQPNSLNGLGTGSS